MKSEEPATSEEYIEKVLRQAKEQENEEIPSHQTLLV